VRRFRLTNLGSRITVISIAIALGTAAVIYVYAVAVGGAASGNGPVKAQILIGAMIALLLAAAVGLYYAHKAANDVSRLQDAARKVADGNFEA